MKELLEKTYGFGRESFQEYPVTAGVLQGFNFGPTLFLLYINDIPIVIRNFALYADPRLYSRCDQATSRTGYLTLV